VVDIEDRLNLIITGFERGKWFGKGKVVRVYLDGGSGIERGNLLGRKVRGGGMKWALVYFRCAGAGCEKDEYAPRNRCGKLRPERNAEKQVLRMLGNANGGTENANQAKKEILQGAHGARLYGSARVKRNGNKRLPVEVQLR
jgi:hypothetical protein